MFDEWLDNVKDRHAQARIAVRVERTSGGNFGDCKALREGIFELRIDWGPSYRVYLAKLGQTLVLLLCGGDKRKQSSDVERALENLRDYKSRHRTL